MTACCSENELFPKDSRIHKIHGCYLSFYLYKSQGIWASGWRERTKFWSIVEEKKQKMYKEKNGALYWFPLGNSRLDDSAVGFDMSVTLLNITSELQKISADRCLRKNTRRNNFTRPKVHFDAGVCHTENRIQIGKSLPLSEQ